MTLINKSLIESNKPELEELISFEKEFLLKYNKRKRGELCEKYVRFWLNKSQYLKQVSLNPDDFKEYSIKKSNLGGIKIYDKKNQRDYELDGIFSLNNKYYILEVKAGCIRKSSIKQFEKLNNLGYNLFNSTFAGLLIFANLENNLKDELNFKYLDNLFNYRITNQMIKNSIKLIHFN